MPSQVQQPPNTDPMTAAILGPDVLAQQYKLQQAQQYAQMLMQQGQEPMPQGQMISGHYVAPSFTQGLGKMLSAYGGRQMMNQIPQQQADLGRAQISAMSQAFGGQPLGAPAQSGQPQQPQQPQQQPGSSVPNPFDQGGSPQPQQPAQPMQPPPQMGGLQGAQSGAMGGGLNQSPQQVQQGRAPLMQPLLGMTPMQSAMARMSMGAGDFAKLQAGQADNRTDAWKNAVNMGLQPGSPQFQQYMAQAGLKSNYIAPTRLGSNAYADPHLGVMPLPNPDKVASWIPDPTSPTGSRTVMQPGGSEAVANQAAAEQAGKNTQTLTPVTAANGPFLGVTSNVVNQAGGQGVGQAPNNRIGAVMATESGGNAGAVSPKGALGTMQTMPNTLRDPGYGVRPAQNNSPAEMQRVGIDYQNAMDSKYKSPILGSIAYNMGPDATDKWLANGGKISSLPKETRDYIAQTQIRQSVLDHQQANAPQQQQPATGAAPSYQQPSQQQQGIALQTQQDKGYQESMGPEIAKHEAAMNDAAAVSVQKIAQNNKLIDAIPSITTGPYSQQVTKLKAMAQQFGVDIGDPAPNQTFDKYAIQGALAGAKAIYGSKVDNMALQTQMQSNPGSTLAQKAIYQLVKFDNILQQRNLDKQNYYYNGYQGPKAQFDMAFNQKFPLQGIAAPQPGQMAAQSAPGATIEQGQPGNPSPAPSGMSSKLKPNGKGGFTYTP